MYPRLHSVTRLNYSTLLFLNTFPNLDIFRNLTTGIGLNHLLERVPSYVLHQATASDLLLYNIFAPTKISLSKFLMTSLQVICDLGPHNQKSWLRLRSLTNGAR